jgi:hypothetical protein
MTWAGAPNPYLPGNPSTVYYYTANTTTKDDVLIDVEDASSRTERSIIEKETTAPGLASGGGGGGGDGAVPVYRLDRLTTKASQPDGPTEDGCSSRYLYANLYGTAAEGFLKVCTRRDILYQYAILKVVVPYGFDVFDAAGAATFGEYDARYFSVSSHICNETSELPFWTVNHRLMARLLGTDAAGAAGQAFYLFFAPAEYVRDLAAAQFGPSMAPTPPVYEWGGFRGYLLGIPDFAFVFRYREPGATWGGNPARSPCYATPLENQPVQGLGDFTPEIYGANFATFGDFEAAAAIGAVQANQPWPSS